MIFPPVMHRVQLALLLATLAVNAQAADIFTGLGGTSATAAGISADGTTVVGDSATGVAYRWSNGVMTSLGTLGGGTTSSALATSADGSVIAGMANSPVTGFQQAFRYQGGVMTGLGFLPGNTYSLASGVSSNGSVVVGHSAQPPGSIQAFRWQGGIMTGLGWLPGDLRSYAYGVSGDGSIVVGYSMNPAIGGQKAFRWAQSTGMTALGFLPGALSSAAFGISADGTTIIGDSGGQAFRWNAGLMSGIGFLPGDTQSRSNAVSFDGSVIVGASYPTPVATTGQAFRWTQATGMTSVVNWLATAGITVPVGWTLASATGVSNNGNVVVGNGTNPAGLSQPWLARVGIASGLLTDIPAYNGTLTRTFPDLANMAMFGAHHRTLLDNGLVRKNANETCVWAVADTANQKTSNTSMTLAEVGACQDIGNMRLGLGISQQTIKQSPSANGSARYDGQALVAEVAHAFDNGVQPSITGYFGRFSTQLSRNYMNAGNMDSSNAAPKADATALRLRLDFRNIGEVNGLSFSPYLSYTRQNTKLAAYSETGGGFPAQFSASNWRTDNLRIGSAAKIALSDAADLRVGIEAIRNINNTGNGVTGNVIGLWSFAQPGQLTKQNAVKLTIDADFRLTPDTAFTFGVNTGSGNDSTWGATTGLHSNL